MDIERSGAIALIDAYFAGWNADDAGAVARLFAPGGTYVDPTIAAPIAGVAIDQVIAPLRAAFPDLHIERSPAIGGDGRYAVEWVMRGHSRGALGPGLGPTGREAVLRGVSVFEVEAAGLVAVRGSFDQKRFLESFGLMVLVQPIAQGPARFGYSMRVASGNPRPPGVIALTWIEGADENEKARIRAHARDNVQDFLAEPGFISIVTGFIGLRGFTVTAWEDEAAMKRGLAGHHAAAMRELFGEDFVAAVWTSVWTPTRVNRLWVRCTACGALADVSDDPRGCRACDARLPERPAYW